MGTLSRADVELLDRNLQDLTDTGLKRQGLKIAQQRADQEHEAEVARELTNRRLLDAEERRGKAEDARLKTQAEGTSDVWLKGPKGGEVHYRGGAEGLQKWLSQGAVPIDKPTTAPVFGTHVWTDEKGDKHTFNLRTQADVDAAQKLADATGRQKKPGFNTAKTRNKQAYDDLNAQAQDLEDSGDVEGAKAKRAEAERWFAPETSGFDTLEIDPSKAKPGKPAVPDQPEVPPTKVLGFEVPFTGKPAVPGSPAVPADPGIVKRTVRVQRGGSAPAPAATNAPDDLVPVLNPSGKPVKIKRSQLADALNQGYKQR